jgi:hypothetical protein
MITKATKDVIKDIKDTILLKDEQAHLLRVELNAEAAAKGAANGASSVIGKPKTDGWLSFFTKN